MALGFIGLSAGGHFHVSEMASALGPALTVLTSLVLITYSGCLLSVMTLGQHIIPFFKGINDAQQMAAGLLIACLSVARSPSSAIAIISELNAKGPFTTVVLAVTVMMDVVVVVLFSISLMVARALDDPSVFMTPREASEDPAIGQARLYRVIGRIVLIEFSQKVLLSALFGVLLGHMLPLFFGWEPRKPTWPLGRSATWAALICASLGFGLRAVIVLMQRASLPLTGWLLFFEEEMAAELDTSDWLNPLICTMVAGFTIVNYTNAGKAFHEAVDSLSGPIYLLFFVFTGCSMDVGVLARNLPACLLIFFTRASLIVVSTYIGGVAAQAPEEFRCRYWMAFLTQAGVTLGLAKDASSHFTWGPDFNATIVAVSVINQVFGPPLMKAALRGAGESHHNYVPRKLEDVSGVGTIGAIGKANLRLTSRPQPRGALVIAEDAHSLHASSEASLVVARLRARGWEVMLADEKLAVTAAEASERQRMDKTAEVLINRLPLEVRQEVNAHSMNAAKPWERVHHTRSLPNLSACLGQSSRPMSSRDGSGEFGSDYVHRLPRGPDLEGGPSSRAAEVAALLGGFGVSSSSSSSVHGGMACGGEGATASAKPAGIAVGSGTSSPARPSHLTRQQTTPAAMLSAASAAAMAAMAAQGSAQVPSRPPMGAPSANAEGRTQSESFSQRSERRASRESRDSPNSNRAGSPHAAAEGAPSPNLRSNSGARRRRKSRDFGRGPPRSHSFTRPSADGRRRSFADLLAPPSVPTMPEDPDEDPERYAQCMRLLWLAASMKSFDVVVCLLSTDDANVAMCELIGDMVPMLQFTRKRDPSPPQVLVTLSGRAEAYRDTFSEILPSPLVLPRRTAMPSLVCEVLHPAAHWSGSLDKEEPDGGAGRISHGDLDGDDADGNEDETPQHSPVRSPLESAPVSRHKPGAAEAFSAIKFTPTKRGSKFGRPAQADLL